MPKWGLRGPQIQLYTQHKVLIFGTCNENRLMYFQVQLEPHEPHSL